MTATKESQEWIFKISITRLSTASAESFPLRLLLSPSPPLRRMLSFSTLRRGETMVKYLSTSAGDGFRFALALALLLSSPARDRECRPSHISFSLLPTLVDPSRTAIPSAQILSGAALHSLILFAFLHHPLFSRSSPPLHRTTPTLSMRRRNSRCSQSPQARLCPFTTFQS